MIKPLTDAELDALVVMVESYVADGWPRVAELIPNAIAELRELRARVATFEDEGINHHLKPGACMPCMVAESERDSLQEQNAAQAYNMGIAVEGIVQLEGIIKELEREKTALVTALERLIEDNERRGLTSSRLSWARRTLASVRGDA